MDKENKLILYKDEEGRVSVNTRFADEDVWLTQAQFFEQNLPSCMIKMKSVEPFFVLVAAIPYVGTFSKILSMSHLIVMEGRPLQR